MEASSESFLVVSHTALTVDEMVGWNHRLDGWMASLTRWTWVWVNSRSWWWTGRPGVLQSMGSQRVRLDWATELNLNWYNSIIWNEGCPLKGVQQVLIEWINFLILAYLFTYSLHTISSKEETLRHFLLCCFSPLCSLPSCSFAFFFPAISFCRGSSWPGEWTWAPVGSFLHCRQILQLSHQGSLHIYLLFFRFNSCVLEMLTSISFLAAPLKSQDAFLPLIFTHSSDFFKEHEHTSVPKSF